MFVSHKEPLAIQVRHPRFSGVPIYGHVPPLLEGAPQPPPLSERRRRRPRPVWWGDRLLWAVEGRRPKAPGDGQTPAASRSKAPKKGSLGIHEVMVKQGQTMVKP